MIDKITWHSLGTQHDIASQRSVDTYTGFRGEWMVGQIQIFGKSGDSHYAIQTTFPAQFNGSPSGQGTLVLAKHIFEQAFDSFLSRAKLRTVHKPMKLEWREKNDRHYLLAGNMLIAIVYAHMGAWVYDYFLPHTIADGEWVIGYREKGIDPLTRYDADTPDNSQQIQRVRGLPLGTIEGSSLPVIQNNVELMVTGWLLQSAFMMRPDPNSLPIGPEQ